MGGSHSKRSPSPPAPPTPSPFYDHEWRSMTWSMESKSDMETKLREFCLTEQDVGQLRIVLFGPVGAGKSSFINSVNNAFLGRVTSKALVASGAGTSFTTTYKTHKIGHGRLPFVFNDVMGLEEGGSAGILNEDLISGLEGHIKENYKFNPISPLSNGNSYYNPSPAMGDKVHCVVNVIPADKISMVTDEVINKLRSVRNKASDLGIPQVVVMTMIDKACPEVDRDLQNIYRSKKIKQKMQECSYRLGVPMNCILPVKNYHEEISVDMKMDLLILSALTQIVHFADDYVASLYER
ncbi:interferon-induced protein 44-like [Denticeps clupeoides]|uniref:interferon-induced protein 44-like n=1 Tax=Denticeps clupeoides TaxID=299321 RepID=UPI0010A36D6E|nr:interferon-induced protein 44-like [Denticeps clupeoides]